MNDDLFADNGRVASQATHSGQNSPNALARTLHAHDQTPLSPLSTMTMPIQAVIAEKLTFNMRGKVQECVALDQAQWDALTDDDIKDAKRALINYKTRNPQIKISENTLFSDTVAGYLQAEDQFISRGKPTMFGGNLPLEDILDRAREIKKLESTNGASATYAETQREQELANAIAKVFSDIKTYCPAGLDGCEMTIKNAMYQIFKDMGYTMQEFTRQMLNTLLVKASNIVAIIEELYRSPKERDVAFYNAIFEALLAEIADKGDRLTMTDIIGKYIDHMRQQASEIRMIKGKTPAHLLEDKKDAKSAPINAIKTAEPQKEERKQSIFGNAKERDPPIAKDAEVNALHGGYQRQHDHGGRQQHTSQRGRGYSRGRGNNSYHDDRYGNSDRARARSTSRDRDNGKSRQRSRSRSRSNSKERKQSNPPQQGERKRSKSRSRSPSTRRSSRQLHLLSEMQAMKAALKNAEEELYCWNCGGVHPGECANRIHCQKNEEYGHLFHESVWGQRWIAAGSPKLIKGHMLYKEDGKPWTIVRVDER